MVLERHVADDSERNKGRVIKVTSLRYAATLHVDGRGFGEMRKYLPHFLAAVNEPFTAHGQSADDGGQGVVGSVSGLLMVDTERFVDQVLRGRKAFGHAHYLAVGAVVEIGRASCRERV